MSFIPPKCTACGGSLTRKSNVNSKLICVNQDCAQEFELIRVTEDCDC